MPPKYRTLRRIHREKGTFEAVSSQTKQRWSGSRESNSQEQEQEWNDGAHEKELSHSEVIDQHHEREIYNPDKKTINWRRQKTTHMRNNTKVYLPRARPKGEKIVLNSQEHVFDKVYQDYIRHDCNEKGNQLDSNISKRAQRGIVKLNKT